jgi:hypothetical protein
MVTLGGITSGPVWVISLSFCSFWFGFSRFCVASCFGLVFSLRSNKDLLLVSKKKKKLYEYTTNFMNTLELSVKSLKESTEPVSLLKIGNKVVEVG